MSLSAGYRLGPYQIVAPLGVGGMGEVYRAHDTKLGRDVAVKVLPDLFAGDPERLARFAREAQVLASINHPNIAAIHGLEDSTGIRALVLELVEGPTLAEKIAAGPLPVPEALPIARQIADALEAAHERGIIHRDLKPANVKVAPDGTVKVLDFGLAKAIEGERSDATSSLSPTLTTPATRAGVILGTAAYMSPEQAKGKAVDRRSDIWAFGCVLYEMLTGRRPFSGDGVSETMAAVIMAPVDLEQIPADVPAPIRRLLRRCLDKDPRQRLRDIGEARIILEATLAGTAEEPVALPSATRAEARRRGFLPAVAAGLVLAAAAGAALMWVLAPRAAPAPLRRFEMPAEGPYRSGIQGNLLAVSPDGSRIAYADGGSLKIRVLDRLESREVVTDGTPAFLFWSPDSAWLGYAAAGKIWKVPADGGQGTIVSDQAGEMSGGSGASWGPDGRIVLARGDPGLYEMPARGGELRQILHADPKVENDFHQPVYLPDGSGILFVGHSQNGRPDRLSLLKGETRKDLLRLEGQDVWFPAYSPTGHIIYRRQPANAGIWALPFSLEDHEVTGEPFLVAPDGDVPSVSSDGTLVYARAATSRATQLAWADRAGKILATVGQPQEAWPFPALSPDGRQVAIAATEGGEHREIWIHDVERGTRSRLTFGAEATYANPAWYPSGDRLLFENGSAWPFSTRAKAADGSGEAMEVVRGWSGAISPDGRWLVYAALDPAKGPDLWMLDTKSGSDPVLFLQAANSQIWPRVSPDGGYIAYTSDETGEWDVYLKRFPSGEGKWQVSVSGGAWPHWSRRGDRLYYVARDALMEVDVSVAGSAPRLGNPHEIFSRPPLGWSLIFDWPAGFDVSADGERFLISLPTGQAPSSRSYILVQNWLAEFHQAD